MTECRSEFYPWELGRKDRTDSAELSSDLPMYPQYTYHTQRQTSNIVNIYPYTHTHTTKEDIAGSTKRKERDLQLLLYTEG